MVCGYCDHHFPLPIDSRFKMLFDDEVFEEIETIQVQDDPIKFKDSKKYTDRLKEARRKTGKQDACVLARGTVSSKPVVAFVMDFAFMGGSMGLAVGKSFVKAVNTAIGSRSALISFTASGGARMQEGVLSLMQMASTIASLCELKETRLPFINVFTHPTTGGVLASFAMLGDINIAEPKALIGFAGAGVIEKTIMQKLPEGFQRSEFLREHGMIDIISHRKDLNKTIQTLLSCLMG
jgi:acetyl-CoA carboxylase carboxyl transferase subunit beta